MHQKHRATKLALLASLAASTIAAAQTQTQTTPTDQPPPSTTNQPAPASQPGDVNIPTDTSATGAAGGTSAGRKSATEEIVVTGSRIRRKDLTTPAPVTVISREQVTASGKVSVGDFLQALPEQGNAINTQFNNGGDGSTRISLRGLGSQRTLVLVNGRRMVPGGTGADASVDLNTIPTAAIERIEILKDGASAVYGSDAIAGVVNVITRRGFRGTELTAYGGTSQRGDGQTYDINATTGTAGERGSVVFSGGYYKQNTVWAGDRDFSKYQLFLDPTTSDCPADKTGKCLGRPGEILVGSGTIPAGRIVLGSADKAAGVNLPNGNTGWNTLVTAPGNTKASAFTPCIGSDVGTATNPCIDVGDSRGIKWRRYVGSGLPEIGGDQYNFQPQNYNVTPAQRIQLYSVGDVNVGSNVRGYYEASFVNRQSEQKLAPEPLLTDGEDVTVSQFSMYNPFGRDFKAVRRRLLEFGNRIFNQDVSTFRIVGGVDGTLPEETGPLHGWFWDASINFGRTMEAGTKQGNIYLRNLQQALGPSMIDPASGRPVCVTTPGDATTAIANCTPLDLFHGAAYNRNTGAATAGTITADQTQRLTLTGVDRGINQMTAVQANTNGELFPLFGDRPIGLALGYEYRMLYGAAVPDPLTVLGEISGNKSEITKGGYHVNEGYGELSIPLVSNMPFAENLEATAAARVFNYSTFGSDWTYKFGARWRPIRDFTLRGTYSTAFRAPSIADLYQGQADNFAAVNDPCKGGPAGSPTEIRPGTPLATVCGSAANNQDDQTQLRSRIGGNPNLTPEKAKIFTLGVVMEPTMIRNFTATVDFYHFQIDNVIRLGIGESVILAGCYPSAAGATPRYCSSVIRDPTTHRISQILNLNVNAGKYLTDGIDFALRYALPTDVGRFGFILDATWLHRFNVTQADGSVLRARGVYDLGSGVNGGVYPAWKANGGVTFGLLGLNLGVTERVIGTYKECAGDSGLMDGSGLCNISQGGHPDMVRTVHPYWQTDVYASYGINTGFGKTTLAVGLNNAFDRAPPVVYNAFTPTSDPSAYDFMGRFVWGRLTQTF
jgi:outer membrane receptor protein involved in Fe transport